MSARERFTAYVTKYALTAGILKLVVEDYSNIAEGMVQQAVPQGSYPNKYHASQWARTREAALLAAEAMRAKKIKSLERQIARLKALEIRVVVPGEKNVMR